MAIRNFRDLKIWERSFVFIKEIYNVSSLFPKEEIYGLTSQIRRAVVSISSNIAEGCGRRTNKDFCSFLYNAMGSLKEVECQLMIAESLGYFKKERLDKLVGEINEIGRMVGGYIRHVSELGV